MLRGLVGQIEATRVLQRVCDGQLTRPLLVVGPAGTGRRRGVVWVARSLFCEGSREPSCMCSPCTQLEQGVHPDWVHEVAAPGKELGVEAARRVVDSVGQYPTQAPFRVVVIEGVDRMSAACANTLLKTLEEPPPFARFFLLAEREMEVMDTVRSRCGRVRFVRLPDAFLQTMVSQFEKDPHKALVYTRLGEGSVGWALHLYGAGRLALRDKALQLLDRAASGDVVGVMDAVNDHDDEVPLLIRLLELIVSDVLLQPVAGVRVNVDKSVEIEAMRRKAPVARWRLLRHGLELLLERMRVGRIHASFHVKVLLIESFANV